MQLSTAQWAVSVLQVLSGEASKLGSSAHFGCAENSLPPKHCPRSPQNMHFALCIVYIVSIIQKVHPDFLKPWGPELLLPYLSEHPKLNLDHTFAVCVCVCVCVCVLWAVCQCVCQCVTVCDNLAQKHIAKGLLQYLCPNMRTSLLNRRNSSTPKEKSIQKLSVPHEQRHTGSGQILIRTCFHVLPVFQCPD